jgi:hypothetical protein
MSVDVRGEQTQTNLFLQQPCQLVATVVNPLAVRCIDHPDQRVRLLEVVLPVGAQRLLPADVPYAVSGRSSEQARCSTYVQFVASPVSFVSNPVNDLRTRHIQSS